MSAVFIPCGGSYDSRRRINLDGVAYDIRTRWNNRSNSWFLYVGLSDQQPLFKSRVVNGLDLLKSYKGIEGCPQGYLLLVDIEKDTGRPTFEELGIDSRFRLLYTSTLEELLELIPEEV